MLSAVKKLWVISRPISWLNTAYPFAAGYIVSGGRIDLLFIIGTLYFLGPYNLLLYGVNDVFDYESDIRNPRKGGIEGAVTAKSFHKTILLTALFGNLPFIVALLLLGSPLSWLTLLVVLFFVVAYSLAKLRFKERPVLDSITSSMHFVGPLIYALTLTHLSFQSLPFIFAFFLWGMASHAFGAVQDIIPDRKAKLASIATILGAKKTIWFSLMLYILAIVITAIQSPLAVVVALASVMYPLNVARYISISDASSGESRVGWRRFIWLNFFVGFVVTIILILQTVIHS